MFFCPSLSENQKGIRRRHGIHHIRTHVPHCQARYASKASSLQRHLLIWGDAPPHPPASLPLPPFPLHPLVHLAPPQPPQPPHPSWHPITPPAKYSWTICPEMAHSENKKGEFEGKPESWCWAPDPLPGLWFSTVLASVDPPPSEDCDLYTISKKTGCVQTGKSQWVLRA